MADLPTIQAGSVHDIATFGGTVPGPGDRVIARHDVSVTEDSTFSFEITDGATLLHDGCVLSIDAFCTVGATDGSSTGTYRAVNGAVLEDDGNDTGRELKPYKGKILLEGTPENWITIRGGVKLAYNSTVLSSRVYDWECVSFQSWGFATFASRLSSAEFDPYTKLKNVVFDGCGDINIGKGGSSRGSINLDKVDFRDTGNITYSDRDEAYNRTLSNITYKSVGTITNTLKDVIHTNIVGFEEQLNFQLKTGQVVNGLFSIPKTHDGGIGSYYNTPITCNDLYILTTGENPHAASIGSSPTVFNSPVFEEGETTTGGGNFVTLTTDADITINRPLMISQSNTQMVGRGNLSVSQVTIDHPTAYSSTSGTEGALKLFEQWGANTNSGVIEISNILLAGSWKSAIHEQNSDNAVVDLYSHYAHENVTNIVSDGDGAGDVDVTPTNEIVLQGPVSFADDTRRLRTWVDHKTSQPSGTTTTEDGIQFMLDMNGYNPMTKKQDGPATGADVSELVAWVRDGFAPTNTELQGVASDGGDIGAMPVQEALSASLGSGNLTDGQPYIVSSGSVSAPAPAEAVASLLDGKPDFYIDGNIIPPTLTGSIYISDGYPELFSNAVSYNSHTGVAEFLDGEPDMTSEGLVAGIGPVILDKLVFRGKVEKILLIGTIGD